MPQLLKKIAIFFVGGYFYYPYLLNIKTEAGDPEGRAIAMSSAPFGFVLIGLYLRFFELDFPINKSAFVLIALACFVISYLICHVILIKFNVLRRLDIYFMKHINNRFLNIIGYLYFLGLGVCITLLSLNNTALFE